MFGRIRCRLGWHDYRVLDITGEFLAGKQCRRCGRTWYYDAWRHTD